MVRDFQSVIGDEAKKQILKYEKRLPNYLVACIGGGSNALGLFYSFLNDYDVKIIGVEAGGEGVNSKNMLHLLQRVNLVFFMEIILIYYKIPMDRLMMHTLYQPVLTILE